MNNVLTAIDELLRPHTAWPIFLGILPDAPDEVVAIFQYSSDPPFHTFGQTNYSYGVQVRTRSSDPQAAFLQAQTVQAALNRYNDDLISIMQATAILDIGQDQQNRYEYTVNFTVFER